MDCQYRAVLNVRQFADALESAIGMTNETSKGVTLSFSKDGLTISARAIESGEVSMSCPVDWTGEPLTLAFNPRLLIDACIACPTDKMTMEIAGRTKPVVLNRNTEWQYLLMPVDLE